MLGMSSGWLNLLHCSLRPLGSSLFMSFAVDNSPGSYIASSRAKISSLFLISFLAEVGNPLSLYRGPHGHGPSQMHIDHHVFSDSFALPSVKGLG